VLNWTKVWGVVDTQFSHRRLSLSIFEILLLIETMASESDLDREKLSVIVRSRSNISKYYRGSAVGQGTNSVVIFSQRLRQHVAKGTTVPKLLRDLTQSEHSFM